MLRILRDARLSLAYRIFRRDFFAFDKADHAAILEYAVEASSEVGPGDSAGHTRSG
jgi:hypothetical protein